MVRELENLQLFDAAGTDDLDFVAHLLIEQRAADRRGGGNLAVGGVGFLAGDQVIGDLFVAFGIEHHHGGAEPHLIVRNLGEIHHGHFGQALLQLADAGIEKTLAIFGRVVLGILAEVAVCARLQDLLGQLDQILVFEHGNFILEFFLNIGHRTGTAPKVTL